MTSRSGGVQVFVSFDLEHDGELYERLIARCEESGFTVSARSERVSAGDLWSDSARRRIREADQMIVICGEHTDASTSVYSELRIAQEERTPYVLLWGRRDLMCTKPLGAKNADGMYSWTSEILEQQVIFHSRKAHSDAAAESLRRTPRAS
jgi:hypothetical protein